MALIKLLKTILLLLLALIVSGYFGVDYYFSQVELKKRKGPVVLGVPEGYFDARHPSYNGPHPATLERPDDPYAYPIAIGDVGPFEPLFSGPNQYPFLCSVERTGLGQPLVDNQDGVGIAVYALDALGEKTEEVVGYSKDCKVKTQAWYFYNREGTDQFFPLDEADNDIAHIELDGKEVDFIVRLEMGVINRYIYAIAAIKGPNEASLSEPGLEHWNGRLLYQFRGGVGIGRRQGKMRGTGFLERRIEALRMGYAIAYSTGTQTKNHYNIWLSEEIVMRIKKQFAALYREPDATFGMGGSGGAIQQYLLAQNRPGLLDGAIALYSYPDMVTQVIYAYDCELLEYYFDVTANDNEKWDDVANRSAIQGLHSADAFTNRYSHYYTLARLVNGVSPVLSNGMTECVNGWRGLVQLTNNPQFIHFPYGFDPKIYDQVHWTHWEDLSYFYGHDETGYAKQAWDNVGVQYGLNALRAGRMTAEEFLDLNANVGGWKPPSQFQQERYWKIIKGTALSEISPWSHHNMTHERAVERAQGRWVSPRTEGDPEAIQALYKSGHVFVGEANIPIIDLRHYLEDQLDMHHLSASFISRKRIQRTMGHSEHQLIWVTRKPHFPIVEALTLLEAWVERREQHPEKDLLASKPEEGVDRCYSETGEVIAEGDHVWDGAWNGKPDGACMQVYPSYLTSRLVAGEGWLGDTFKCDLQPVEEALNQRVYGEVDMSPYLDALSAVFPQGVCDYSKQAIGKVDVEALYLDMD